MTLTKIRTWVGGQYEYINLDHVEAVEIDSDHYDVRMSDKSIVCAHLDDPTITALISAADSAYTGA